MNYMDLTSQTLDNLMEGFQLIDREWRYRYVNEAVVNQSRYPSKEDLLGYTIMNRYPGVEETDLFQVLTRCMNQRQPAVLNNEFIFPDGSSGWFELRIHPVPDGIFILSLDISERIRAEQERKKYTEGLEEMIEMTSFRVRPPVSNILSLATLLDESRISLEEMKQICLHMKSSAALLDTFIQELAYFIQELKR